MAQNPIYTTISSLPGSTTGKVRVVKFHLDDNHDVLNQAIENAILATYSQGGVTKQGTTSLSGTTFSITDHAGISIDMTAAGYITSASHDVASAADGKHRLVMMITPSTTARTYTDPETSETITHDMATAIGVLGVIEGDATNYPTLTGNVVPIIKFEMSSGTVTTWSDDGDYIATAYTVDNHEAASDPHPQYQKEQAGATASRPASPATGEMYFDTTLGKPIWYDGSNWVDATGTTV